MDILYTIGNFIKLLINCFPSICVALTVFIAILSFLIKSGTRRKAAASVNNCVKKIASSKKYPLFLFSMTCICWCIIFFTLFFTLRVSFIEFIKFILFFIVYIILPGYLIIRKIEHFRNLSVLFTLCSITGISILISVYLISSFVGFLPLIYWISPICSVASGILIRRDWRNNVLNRVILRIDIRLICVISLMLVYSITSRALKAFPELSGDTSFFMDSMYIISNSSAMTGGLFADSLNFPGFMLRYHAITNILQACAINVTGISAVKIFLVYWPILYLSIGLAGIHALIVTYRKNDRFASLAIFLMMISEHLTVAVFHLFDFASLEPRLYMAIGNLEAYYLVLPNGIDIAIPALLATAIIIIKCYRNECSIYLSTLLAFLFTCITTGSKVPFGICVCGALTGTLLFMLFQKKKRKSMIKPLLLLLSSILGFLAIYIVIIYNPVSTGKSTVSLFNLLDTRNSLHFEYTYSRLLEYFPQTISEWFQNHELLSMLLMLPISMLFILPFFMPMFITWSATQISKFQQITRTNLLMCGIAICGICGHYLIAFDGYAQVYFFFSAIFFVEILGFYWAADNFKTLHYSCKILLAVLLSASLFCFMQNSIQQMKNNIKDTYQIIKKQYTDDAQIPAPSWDSITAYEYEGMKWLKNNTPKNSLIAIDRHFNSYVEPENKLESIDQALYFYYPAYSERHMFLGGFAYSPRTDEMEIWIKEQLDVLDKLYDPVYEDKAELMEKHDIDYLVVSKFISANFKIKDDGLKKVFNNRDISIYQLK